MSLLGKPKIFNYFIILALLLCFIKSATSQNTPPIEDVGINLSPLFTESTQWAFTDLFKQSRPLYPAFTRDQGKTWTLQRVEELILSEDGYPKMLNTSSSSTFAAIAEIGSTAENVKGNLFTDGEYVLLYDGEGEIWVDGDASVKSSSANRLVLNVANNAGKIFVRIVKTNSEKPLKNIRIVPSVYESTYLKENVFHPTFLEKIDKFKLLRFCDWQNEIWAISQVKDWTKRKLRTHQTQAWRRGNGVEGVSFDHIIDLLLLTKKDAWFCLPYNGNDAYFEGLAKLLFDNIPQEQKIYIQFGNLINFQAINSQGPNITKINDIFVNIFGAERRAKQIVTVATADVPEYWPYILNSLNKDLSKIDAIGLSGKVGQTLNYDDNYLDVQKMKGFTEEQIISELRRVVLDQQDAHNKIMQQVRVYNREVVAFDGGVFLRAPRYGWRFRLGQAKLSSSYLKNETLENLAALEQDFALKLINVNKNPALKEILLDHLARWRVIGGRTFVASPLETAPDVLDLGFVGLLEKLSQAPEQAPKYSGFISFINGEKSKLPYTSADLSQPEKKKCSVNCLWGVCLEGSCKCFAGYSGAACDVLNPETIPNRCTDSVGINLAGIADWSTEWVFTDMFKMSRNWVSQEFTSFNWNTDK